MVFHSFLKITMVATPKSIFKPVSFFGSSSCHDSGCDTMEVENIGQHIWLSG